MRPARGSRLRLVGTCLIALGLAFVAVNGSAPQQADLHESADLGLFDPGNIIDDDIFYNPAAMDAAQVQDFLATKGSACSGDLCLKNYRQTTTDQPADDRCRHAYAGARDETAAQIIHKVAHACVINPQALLVVLQKEQGLVTTTVPQAGKLDRAMGYKCPDTAPCDPQYFGFFNQVYNAAWQYNSYRVYPSRFGHRAGMTNDVRYHPRTECGTVRVYIQNQATAGLYNYTPYTPNAAALRAGYGTGDGCSAYGNRNFFSYFTDWFGSTQSGPASIDDKYRHLRANGVDLGASTTQVTCDLPHGGCYRSYEGGTIFWHRDTGPHVVRGAILAQYQALGGPGLLGYPTGDDTAAPFGTGYYTDFQGGAIYWSPATGAHEVRGELLATWRTKNAQAGVLGYPVGGDEAVPGGYRTRFQGGTLYWSAATRARMVRGALLERYEAAGGPRVLGFPTVDDGPAVGGAKVDVQGGAIYWSPDTGAHVVRGAVLTKWRQWGAESGSLGYPEADEAAVAGGARAAFEGGHVYWSAATGARVLRGPVLERYLAHGGPAVLGFPTTHDVAAADGGRRAELQGGAVYWSSETGAHVVRGEILARWRALGAEGGRLGYPTGDDAATPRGGHLTTFRNGTVYWSSSTGARVLRGAILRRYVAAGGPGALGFPTADEVAIRGGAKAELQGGAVYWSSETGAHVVRGEILARWRALGAEGGRLGFPTGSDTPVAGGYTTTFRNGTVYWSSTTGAKVVRGAIARRYLAAGGPGVLGFPTADEVAIRGGAKAELQRGAVYWSSETGAHVVRGEILARWRALGAESGQLGYPTGDDTAVAGGYTTAFRNGTVYWSSTTGAKVVRGAIARRYLAAGGPAVLGFPTTDEASIRGGAKAELQRGAVYWSPSTGARVVEAPAARAYADLGGPASDLGFPTVDTRAVPGGRRTDFQGGHIVATPDGAVTVHRT